MAPPPTSACLSELVAVRKRIFRDPMSVGGVFEAVGLFRSFLGRHRLPAHLEQQARMMLYNRPANPSL